MKAFFLAALLFSLSLFASDSTKDSIVQIVTTHRDYDYDLPWAPPSTERSGGSGFIIADNLVMTNAHVVKNASYIEVRSANSRRWYEARVKMVGHDCDLALLELEDPTFFDGKIPLEFGEKLLPQQEEVTVYGFPMGGRELSITKGIVSRVELGNYSHSGAYLLMSQIDAPINPGNSGGPVISGGNVVGVAYQGYMIGQNLGYMIPIPVIQHFLEEAQREEYLGFPCDPINVQPIRNQAMRSYYGIEEDHGGLLVVDVPKTHLFSDLLKQGDIVVNIDGYDIDPYGWVELEGLGISLPVQYLIMMKHYGDPIEVIVLRNGERVELRGVVDPKKKGRALIKQEFDKAPTYFISGGLVFQPLVQNYLPGSDILRNLGVMDLFYNLYSQKLDGDREEIIILSCVLDDMVNVGYQHLDKKVVDQVNGQRVRNFRELVDFFDTYQGEYIFLKTSDGVEIILDQQMLKERNHKILNRYLIHHDRSVDLQ